MQLIIISILRQQYQNRILVIAPETKGKNWNVLNHSYVNFFKERKEKIRQSYNWYATSYHQYSNQNMTRNLREEWCSWDWSKCMKQNMCFSGLTISISTSTSSSLALSSSSTTHCHISTPAHYFMKISDHRVPSSSFMVMATTLEEETNQNKK